MKIIIYKLFNKSVAKSNAPDDVQYVSWKLILCNFSSTNLDSSADRNLSLPKEDGARILVVHLQQYPFIQLYHGI